MIILFDGTSDSRKLALDLSNAGYDIIATATTEDGVLKLEKEKIKSMMGKLDYKSIMAICREYPIEALIDATHPYANSLHETCIRVGADTGIPLIRYERESTAIQDERIYYVDSYEAAERKALDGKNIFVTTGIKHIELFRGIIQSRNTIIRIIPDPENIKLLLNLGIKKDHIIAMEGTLDEKINRAIMEYYNIDTLITKDSGFNSDPKIKAALSFGINVIIISRKHFPWNRVAHNEAEMKKILNEIRIK